MKLFKKKALEENKDIVDVLDRLDSLCDNIEITLENLRSEIVDLEEANNKLLVEMRSQLALLSEKK